MIILVGASATGKTQVGNILASKYGYKKLITYTSRNIRIGEVNDVDYHFVTKEFFESHLNDDFFFEIAQYNGNYYGTAKMDIKDDTYVILEPNGLKSYLYSDINVVSFYLKASKKTREMRMNHRRDKKEDILMRINLDDKHFPEDIPGINYVIATDNYSVEAIADMINIIVKK